MKQKHSYQHPEMHIINLQHQNHLLAGSGEQPAGGPSANFMSNPGIGETDEE